MVDESEQDDDGGDVSFDEGKQEEAGDGGECRACGR